MKAVGLSVDVTGLEQPDWGVVADDHLELGRMGGGVWIARRGEEIRREVDDSEDTSED